MIPAELIKERVSVPMLLERYGVKVDRGGRCACPIHHGKHANMAVKPRWFRCYKCGRAGTVIDLQMALTGTGFGQAVSDLDTMFGLNLRPRKPSQRIAARLALAEHKRNARARTARRLHNEHQYTILCYLRRYCAGLGVDCGALDSILDYYLGYDGGDVMPDAFRLAAHAGVQEEMEMMLIGAYDTEADCADDG